MNTKIRISTAFVALCGMVFAFAKCAPINGLPFVQDCGPGYTYQQQANTCVPDTLICDKKCDTDHKCALVNGEKKCVPRLPQDPEPTKVCAVTCGDNEICEDGKCVPAPCNPPCQSGFTCSHGTCTPVVDCHPPCQQTGYVCVNGLCERICPSPCTDGKICVRGVCQKPCSPACGSGEFCDAGKCRKLEDADKDGFRSDQDCDDNDRNTNPGAVEVCNKKDSDCDGRVDNIVPKACYTGASGTLGVGKCAEGRAACDDQGKLICEGVVVPDANETCKNGVDDDCNGKIDDGCP